jgi:diguanylate cyclase (GGDEF)-like protein
MQATDDYLGRVPAAAAGPCDPAGWARTVALSLLPDEAEELSGFGRWWLERASGNVALSLVAADFLGVRAGQHAPEAMHCLHVIAEDAGLVRRALACAADGRALADCEFRLIDPVGGLRWLRLRALRGASSAIASGVLIDITPVKQAAMREKFNFALTQFLIGTDTLGDAVTRIIQLVCEDLGWEWGAYWGLNSDQDGAARLTCKHSWHRPEESLLPFRHSSEAIAMAPSHGLVGRVWRTGHGEWIDVAQDDSAFMRGGAAAACGLRSGYIFPVTYVTPDGALNSPGVLEFFSKLPRQREAQLPALAASIGALIALTAQRMVQQERIRHFAITDELTGLANRKHFHSLVDAACDAGARAPFAVLYIDLDQFKPINDAFGHQAGNVVLSEFARRLRTVGGAGCSVGRLGGDEFALLAAPGMSPAALELLAERVLQAARTSFMYEGHELSVSASIGISCFPAHGGSTAELLHAADAAMYVSKRNGRNLATRFSDDGSRQQLQLAGQLTLLSELHHAHERNEFFLEYQPIFDSFVHQLVAVEALIRWRRPDGEIVPPDLFIPVAEQSRLMVRLGRWIAEQACRDLPLMHAAGMQNVKVHINMAAPEFIDSELPSELMSVVRRAGIAPRHLCLELTESVVMSHPEKSISIMRQLQALGFEISLDDFGMGYSSLAMLKQLPISSLKIDRLFVGGLPHERTDCAIVRAILDLGRNMKIRVIAEGVENDAQMGFLRQYDCDVQGYLLGRPMPMAQLLALHGKRQ